MRAEHKLQCHEFVRTSVSVPGHGAFIVAALRSYPFCQEAPSRVFSIKLWGGDKPKDHTLQSTDSHLCLFCYQPRINSTWLYNWQCWGIVPLYLMLSDSLQRGLYKWSSFTNEDTQAKRKWVGVRKLYRNSLKHRRVFRTLEKCWKWKETGRVLRIPLSLLSAWLSPRLPSPVISFQNPPLYSPWCGVGSLPPVPCHLWPSPSKFSQWAPGIETV